MAEDKPTTEFARKSLAVQPVQPVKAGAKASEAPEEKVMVQAVRTFSGSEGFKNPQSAPFEIPRRRAVDLFANGLVEYASAEDEKREIDASVRDVAEKRKREREAARLKDSDKTTPLKNPKLPGVED